MTIIYDKAEKMWKEAFVDCVKPPSRNASGMGEETFVTGIISPKLHCVVTQKTT
jgi:hypothetical protein